jgi:4-hydroxyproline epimerase
MATLSNAEMRVRVIDSHTGGEPTRVVIDGGPELGAGSLSERRAILRDQFDWFRSAVVNEPRGSEFIVGALLTPPTDPTCCAGVIFFSNVDVLYMCGHGTIGVVVTLARLGRIATGSHRLETPVGIVGIEYHGGGRVSFENVPSYRLRRVDDLDVPGIGRIVGDIAWGGNWFFLTGGHGLDLTIGNLDRLNDYTWRIRRELVRRGITGADGGEIDHIELIGPPRNANNSGRSFVLCPGGAYDRSPCGTGTSAKLACLHAEGKLKPGDVWRQESVIGSVFEGSIRVVGERGCVSAPSSDWVIPRITGSAFVTAESTLILDPADPFRTGFPK